jgi:hypothetical protein
VRFTVKKILAAAAVPATAVGVLAFGGVANASTTHSAANASSTTHSAPSWRCDYGWHHGHHGRDCDRHGRDHRDLGRDHRDRDHRDRDHRDRR